MDYPFARTALLNCVSSAILAAHDLLKGGDADFREPEFRA
jgi:hypothetical protein